MFSYNVLPAPAPSHTHSNLPLTFGVNPYSTPAPAARPACSEFFEVQEGVVEVLQRMPTPWVKLDEAFVAATPAVP